MLKSNENYKLEKKDIVNVTRKLDGKEFALNTLYLKAEGDAIKQVVVNKYIYDKANEGAIYKICALLDYNGKLSINDIELQK